jgi:hypothetical protein
VRDGFEFEQALEFEPGRTVEILAAVPAAAGVFALFGHSEADQPYLTRTANLRRRLQRLLAADAAGNAGEKINSETDQDTNPTTTESTEIQSAGQTLPSKRLNLSRRVARIAYSRTGSEFEATLLLFRASVALLGLEAAERRLRLHAPFVVRMAVENAYPRAYVTNRISPRALKNYYGPFPSRAAAERYLDESLNLFKLRRCHEELHPDPAFPGCVYSEMKMCLAPCFKGCSDERYAEEAAAVGEYLATRGGSLVTRIATARDAASEALNFERAAQFHAAMTKAEAAVHLADEIVRPIAELDAVMVQAGVEKHSHGKNNPGSAALFLVRGGLIAGPVVVAATDDSADGDSAKTKNIGERVMAAMEVLAAMPLGVSNAAKGRSKVSSRMMGCNLAMLRRWYYRTEKQRKGEIFFRNENGSFPMKRILNAVGRAANAAPAKSAQADAPEEAAAAAADTLAVE